MSFHKLKMIFFFDENKAKEYDETTGATVMSVEKRAAIQFCFNLEGYPDLKRIIWE